jgi:signal transduction histidine kinase
MRESTSVAAAPAERLQEQPGPGTRPTRDPPAGTAADSLAMTLRMIEDHDRIAGLLNDTLVHRLFSAALSLEASLGQIGGHPAAGRIRHALSELDVAIREVRDIVFDSRRPDWPVARRSGRG